MGAWDEGKTLEVDDSPEYKPDSKNKDQTWSDRGNEPSNRGQTRGKNFGFLFAKMMDVMSEDMTKDASLGVRMEELVIALLEWVDDVVTFAIGRNQQIQTMARVNEFAVKHKLKWGRDKCNVMEVGFF